MKLFLLSGTIIGALIIIFFTITIVITSENLGDWIMFSSLITLLFMCVAGIALNHKSTAVTKRVNSKIPDLYF